jgi:hypothetical protein
MVGTGGGNSLQVALLDDAAWAFYCSPLTLNVSQLPAGGRLELSTPIAILDTTSACAQLASSISLILDGGSTVSFWAKSVDIAAEPLTVALGDAGATLPIRFQGRLAVTTLLSSQPCAQLDIRFTAYDNPETSLSTRINDLVLMADHELFASASDCDGGVHGASIRFVPQPYLATGLSPTANISTNHSELLLPSSVAFAPMGVSLDSCSNGAQCASGGCSGTLCSCALLNDACNPAAVPPGGCCVGLGLSCSPVSMTCN